MKNSPRDIAAAEWDGIADNYASKPAHPVQRMENNTGLPDGLKSGIENLSGISLDDVRIHRNADEPALLQAHAYAESTDIYLGPGQEKHLPHEVWHVVQQKQGRVKATKQIQGGININDDVLLEKEADLMGRKALKFVNNRSETQAQRKLGGMANSSPRIQQLKAIHEVFPYNSGAKVTAQLQVGALPASPVIQLLTAVEEQEVRQYFNLKIGGIVSTYSQNQTQELQHILQESTDVADAKSRINQHAAYLNKLINEGMDAADLVRRGGLGLDNFLPHTGLGKFDAIYNPVAGELKINLRAKFNFTFETLPETMSLPKTALTALGLFFRSIMPAWSSEESQIWKQQFIQDVTAAWSGKHTFQCNEFGWDLPDVGVVITVEEVMSRPHFEVLVHKQFDQQRLYSAYNEADQLTDPNVQRRVHYQQNDLGNGPHTQAKMLAEQQSLNTTLMAKFKQIDGHSSRICLTFADNILDKGSEKKLAELLMVMSKVEQGMAQLILYYDTSEHLKTVLHVLGNFSNKTEQFLKANGVQVGLQLDPAYTPPQHYSTAVHEFGHMLGNVDLYRDEQTKKSDIIKDNPGADLTLQNALIQAQQNYLQLVNAAGLAHKAPMVGLTTSSVMSMGDHVMDTDYLTIWEALKTITSPQVKNWKIK